MNRAPRVLVLASVLGQAKGGVWRHNRELLPRAARLLAERGGSLSLLEGSEACAFELPAGVERLSSKIPPRPVLRRALAEGHALRRSLAQHAARGIPFEVLHTAHQPVPRGFGIPLALLIHDLRSLQAAHSPFSRRLFARELLGRSAQRAASLMTVSECMADAIAQQLGVERGRIRVIPNAGDHLEARRRRAPVGAPLVCIGHLEPRKNQELLLRALALDPALPTVHFIGAQKAGEQARLQRLASELGVQTRAQFLGPCEDAQLEQQLACAGAVVLPSQLEGFGIVVLEAQRARVPLAISAIPAHLEVAASATPSFENDAADCARAIRAALELEPAQLESAAQAASRYCWDASAAQLVDAWCAAARSPSVDP